MADCFKRNMFNASTFEGFSILLFMVKTTLVSKSVIEKEHQQSYANENVDKLSLY